MTSTAFAPILALSSTVTGPRTFAPAPICTLLPIVGWRLPGFIDTPPRVTPWNMRTSSPTSAVSPMTTPMPWSMKKRLPILAAGWISMPVAARAAWASARAANLWPVCHRRCAARWAHSACTPG